MDLPFGLNPYEHDQGAWGASLLNNADILLACLDIAGARSVTEVGAYAGDFTRLLLLWGATRDTRVTAIDPSPHERLEQLAREHAELKLVRETSFKALEHIPLPDVVVLDGDHNYYTVSEELRTVAARSDGRPPLLLLHDVCWPHGRRDDYFNPDHVPAEHRQPYVRDGGLYPGHARLWPGGLPFNWPAAREGGPRNGVLTAVEDFLNENRQLELAIVPTFFGIGVVWHRDAPYAKEIAELLAPWDRNALIERLERNRVLHLSSSYFQLSRYRQAHDRLKRIEKLLNRMLDSRAFWAAEMYLRMRQRGEPHFSREQIRELLDEPELREPTPS